MSKTFKPGQTAPRSGQYEQVGPRGGSTGSERTVTRGEPLPPTPKPRYGLPPGRSDQALTATTSTSRGETHHRMSS
ncbi:YjzC family protein [Sphingomonas sp. DT-207]|uniref:YjzC family protein n=1 Tax=Sphingomonas sp. DT-207 TaxID=3396167 RepID=UPI003F1AA02B